MPVAHYNSYLSAGDPHPAYRNYESERGMGPPPGSLSDGAPLVHPRPPSLHAPQDGYLTQSSVPSFTLPPSGVPYTGPFPQNRIPGANYQRGLDQFASSSQSGIPVTNINVSGASMASSSSSCLTNYPQGMDYPAHPGPQHQNAPLMESHGHYMNSREVNYHQYPTYRTPEESPNYHDGQDHHLQPQYHHQQHYQQGAVMQRPLENPLGTIYEDCPTDTSKYQVEEYLQQHSSSDIASHRPSVSRPQIRLTPQEVLERQCPPPPGAQGLATPKTEPEWWHDSDVLMRLQQIHLHNDHSPSRERTTPKRKRRNSEKRKEKSRDAARCRRGKESEIFTELANALPLPAQTIAQLDKASIMRLTIAFLKTRALCQAGLMKKIGGIGEGSKLDVEMDAMFLKALDGFLLVLSTDADVVYTSENISTFLGLPQVDVMGQSLYDYTHPCDHDEVRELASAKGPQEPRHAFVRLKCTLTSKGRSVNLKSASYKVVQVSGELVKGEDDESWLVALGTPVPHPSNIEFPLDKQTFVSKHSLDMKFTYVDDNVKEFCGYGEDELLGRSLYQMHHALDSDLIKEAYKTLRSKGQVETGRYRFLAREGGYIWVVTQATLIHGPKDHKPQYVVCLNYVVSGVESPDEVLSDFQLKCSKSLPCAKSLDIRPTEPVAPVVRNLAAPSVVQRKTEIQPKVQNPVVNDSPVPPAAPARITGPPPPPTPVATTFKIFTPRTEEMNKGYLIFSEDDPLGIVMKDEPDDLTHLAPSGGDTCVPLEVPTFIPDLDDDMFGLDCKQLPISNVDALFSSPTAFSENFLEDSLRYKTYYQGLDNGKKIDRLNYSKVTAKKSECGSPLSDCDSAEGGLRTPDPPNTLASKSPPLRSSPVTASPVKGVVESSRPRTTTESLFLQLDDSALSGSSSNGYTKLEPKSEDTMDSDEFDMRAPYIPLSNELLMLNQDDLMWGAPPDPGEILMNKRDSKQTMLLLDDKDSSLAQLLQDRDPAVIPGTGHGKNNQSSTPNTPHRNQYQQQSKFLDGGGSFVDPNKVLPGHFGGKDGIDDGGGTAEELPLLLMMREPVEPPPPLQRESLHQQSTMTPKRRYSPSSSPILTHKKLCSLPYDQQQKNPQTQHSLQTNQKSPLQIDQLGTGVRELSTPYAPTMQQLLISKDPIMVRGGRPGGGGGSEGGTSAPVPIMHRGKDSVLRNLLHLCNEGEDISNEGNKQSATPIRITPDQMTAILRADGGAVKSSGQIVYPKLRIVTGGSGQSSLLLPEHHFIRMTSGTESGGGSSSSPTGGGGGGGDTGEGFVKRGRRQDVLLMDPDLTIPNLFDLSQLDYEVNAPANNSSLLQGADLLMALDQSL